VQNERLNRPTGSDWYHAVEFGMTKRASSRGSAIVSMTIVKNHRWITNTFDTPNANAPTAITVAAGPSFGYYTSIVPPRVARLGAKFNF
jgi:hypothetical protein